MRPRTSAAAHRALPRSDEKKTPQRWMLHSLRPLAAWLLRRRYDVRLHQAEQVPADGPVIFASNHIGVIDGPMLAIYAPRPVHALTKQEMFKGLVGRLLRMSGQIRLDRFHTDPDAVKTCLRALRDGRAVGIYPEGTRGAGDLARFHRGAAYLALVSGAPVVPVIMLGSREPGGGSGSLPHRGATIDMVFGEPFRIDAVAWPRTREQVEKHSLLLREHMLVLLDQARALTGRELPGPLPGTDVEPDPATGVTEQGAP
jgi:1-acyl-sn-glycerol-3-phosphate acyltransferase